ncbi:MAG TPA: alkaline phosphatase PhoX, partial [Burkholderiales bacterium]|nr:alkaline phosphatase PhoX [Burkholderiales bacterium]
MSRSYSDDNVANPSDNPHIAAISEARLTRRGLLKAAGALSALSIVPFSACSTTPQARGILGFASIDISTDDTVRVPPGYSATPFYRWGDAIGHASGSPSFRADAGNTSAEQALQAGMHHDGIHYFPLPYGSQGSTRGLLAMNHEYTDDGLLHPGGFAD